MASLALKQREVKELLDSIMTVIEERRINAGQKYEAAKRRLNDADNKYDRDLWGTAMDTHKVLEERYQSLVDEVGSVIEDTVGSGWRSNG